MPLAAAQVNLACCQPNSAFSAAPNTSCRLPFSFPHVGITRTSPPLPESVAAEAWTIDHNRVQVGGGLLSLGAPPDTWLVSPEQLGWAMIEECCPPPCPPPCPRICLQLGSGRQAYRKAQALLQRWAHFDLGWASVNAPPVKPGAPVVVTAQTLFCWSCNPLRISFVEEARLRRQELPPWAGAPAPAVNASSRQQQHWESGSKSSSGGGFRGLARGSGARVQQQLAAKGAAGQPPRGRRYAFAHTTLEGHQIGGEERFAVAWNQEDDSGGRSTGAQRSSSDSSSSS